MLQLSKYVSPSAMTALLSAAVLLFFPQSCNKNLQCSDTGETATVTLKFSAGSPEQETQIFRSGTSPAGVVPGEGIKTLRVIMTSVNKDGKVNVLKNEKKTYTDEASVRTLTLFDVPLGVCNFYAIANEESVGKEFTTEVIRAELEKVDGGEKLLFEDLNNTYFPYVSTDGTPPSAGLPISGHIKGVTISKDMASLYLEVRRAVAKINLSVNNMLGRDLTLSEIDFGSFFSDRLFVFSESALDVPADASYMPLIIKEDKLGSSGTLIPADGSYTCTVYMYPSYAWKSGLSSPYTLSLRTVRPAGNYPPIAFVDKTTSRLNSIARNTQVNINATIQTTADVTINFQVTDWVGNTVDVPSFN